MFTLKSLGVSCLALLVAAGVPTLADERVEKTLTLEEALPAGGELHFWNLIGSVEVTPGKAGTPLSVEARVVVEADSMEQAEALAESFALDRRDGGVHVSYPVDRFAAFRLPRSEKEGLVSKWVMPLVKKDVVALVYDDRMVEVGGKKGSAAVAVHLDVTLPLDVDLAVHQYVGTIRCAGLRGDVELEIVQGEALAEQIYGNLEARTGGGEIQVWRFAGEIFDVQTGTGAIVLNDVKAERLHLLTQSGEITGDAISATELRVESESGMVRLDGVEPGSFEVRTLSGNVDIGTPLTRTRSGSIESGSGDVTLRVGKFAPFDLVTRSGSGAVKLQGLKIEQVGEDDEGTRYRRRNGGIDLHVSTGGKGKLTVKAM
jgi:hypothetical protein